MSGQTKIDINTPPPLNADVVAQKNTATVAFAVAGYGVCSSLMLVCNKVAVTVLPSPTIVLFAQLFTSAAAVWIVGQMGYIKVDKLEWGKATAFAPVACAFLAAIFTNIKTLQYANVETFIVFRASTPIIVSVCDYMFLGRELPGARSWMSLLGLVGGAFLYVYTDHQFHVSGYYWVCVWYMVFCFDQVYIKHAIESVKMESNWGRVFYTNLLACFPLLGTGIYAETTGVVEWTNASIAALFVSCMLGVGMSYFAFLCRKMCSAAAFTVIGNVSHSQSHSHSHGHGHGHGGVVVWWYCGVVVLCAHVDNSGADGHEAQATRHNGWGRGRGRGRGGGDGGGDDGGSEDDDNGGHTSITSYHAP
eukprot:CAMPEP_0119477880 /NCGR_PEP_ID=MMETSP1344-20130328/7858_1 /TAXON_ID=236787 /ORGANISM="Florenciella parvula, Strain CCMP2471" /LENGTH=361 /DNA_ID=CAMNT_0007511979 /DNA_START=87 /DNA_END=1169 /DNA_ORIENTATION=+